MENSRLLEVGDIFRFDFSYTQAQVNHFAEVTADDNPLHIDETYAASTIFKKPIIHGFLGGSVFSKVFGTMFPGAGTIYLKQSMTFLKPMYINELYTALFEIKDIHRDKHKATVSTRIMDKLDNEVVSGEAIILNANKI